MDVRWLKALRGELDVFVSRFSDCIKTAPSRRHLGTYIAGQVGDLERKTAAAIALDAEVPPRSLQEFLALHRWDEGAVRNRVQEVVREGHGDPNAIAVIDETSFAKKGTKTAGVARQYCGSTGKVDNCVVSVHLGYVAKDFHALLDGDLYLPKAWLADGPRCEEAGIPPEVVYRAKWRIAVDLLRHALANRVDLRYLTADEEYGRCGPFRAQVDALGVVYVVEVPGALTGWARRPRVVGPGRGPKGRGRPRTKAGLAPTAPRARRLDSLWKHRGPPWEAFHIKNTHKGPVVWEARAVRFFPCAKGLPADEVWLVVARNVLDGEVKFFFSNAGAETPLGVLLHVAFSRDHIEKLFKESKGQVGLDHFEVQRYRAVRRHLLLSMVSVLFLAEQSERLRGEKPVVEHVPGACRHRGATRP
jgi:SRSO17 transposase